MFALADISARLTYWHFSRTVFPKPSSSKFSSYPCPCLSCSLSLFWQVRTFEAWSRDDERLLAESRDKIAAEVIDGCVRGVGHRL
jgi:hypothetical protein